MTALNVEKIEGKSTTQKENGSLVQILCQISDLDIETSDSVEEAIAIDPTDKVLFEGTDEVGIFAKRFRDLNPKLYKMES